MKKKIYISLTLIILVIAFIFSFHQKDYSVIENKTNIRTKNSNMLSIMLETSEGSGAYEKNSSNSWPQDGYAFNESLSKCEHGGELSWDGVNKQVLVYASTSDKCYIYFDKIKKDAQTLVKYANLWNSGLENDGYRYVGTDPDNYICFGTTDLSQCKSNTDAYMYRIIGVFSDSDGNQHMKLIKKEALNSSMQWNDSNSDVDWGNSTLYSSLNGSTYLSNTTYMPNSTWNNKIVTWTWRAMNTKTYENTGTNYLYTNPKGIYQNEILKTTNNNIMCGNANDNDGTSSRCTKGVLTTPSAKIGLMYASDYALSLGSIALNLTTVTNANGETLKTSWMHLSNNDTSAPNSSEWTIARYGKHSNNYYRQWGISQFGYVYSELAVAIVKFSVRPVFYLNSEEVIQSGTGTIDDPYIITE